MRAGRKGFLVSPGDAEKLGRSIGRLRDPALREAMGRESRRIVAENVDGVSEEAAFIRALTALKKEVQ